jgi:hypothetical protein
MLSLLSNHLLMLIEVLLLLLLLLLLLSKFFFVCAFFLFPTRADFVIGLWTVNIARKYIRILFNVVFITSSSSVYPCVTLSR